MINKLADLQDFNQLAKSAIVERLLKMWHVVKKTELPFASHMQRDWLRLWEYAGAIVESGLDKRMTVLDAGGSGTIFSFYMAAEGCVVHTVDAWDKQVDQAKRVSEALGLQMHHSVQDIAALDYGDLYFDAVYCISVIEHMYTETQEIALKELARVLKPGGVLSLTFDYGKNAADFPILSSQEVLTRLVIPSGLEVMGNREFHAESNDLLGTTLDYTFGALFLRKPGELSLANSDFPQVGTPALIDMCHSGHGFSSKYYPGRRPAHCRP